MQPERTARTSDVKKCGTSRNQDRREIANGRRVLLLLSLTTLHVPAFSKEANQPMWIEPPKDDKPAVLFVGHPAGYVEPALASELTDKGFILDHSSWESLDSDRLRRFNTLVLLSLGDHGRVAWLPKYEDLIDGFLRQGGGVITFFNHGEGFNSEAKRYFAKYGLELVHMQIQDPANAKDFPRPEFVYGQKIAPADTIIPSPITEGVKAIWYGQSQGGHGMPSSFPLIVDANWTPVVVTRPTATASAQAGFAIQDENIRNDINGKAGAWPLVAIRQIGHGRMVAISLAPTFYVWSPHFEKWDEVLYRNGIGDLPSNFDRLLENSLRWTAAPSLERRSLGYWAGLYPPRSQGDTPPFDWATKTFTEPGPWLKGHVGARTAYSGGRGTVADWVAAAKAEGLSFLVFLEDMSRMDAVKWEALQKDCQAASTGDFRCYPGMRYRMRMATGGENHCFVVDGRCAMPFPLQKMLDADNAVIIKEGMSDGPYHLDFKTTTTVGFMRHKDNATPYWDYKLYGVFSVLARDAAGTVIDDEIETYLEQVEANVNPAPLAIELLDDPAQLKGVLAQGRPHVVVNAAHDGRYPHLPAGLGQVDVHVGSRGDEWNPGFGNYRGWWGPCATEGPRLSLRFRGGYQWKGVEYPRYWIERYASVEYQDWFMPFYARLPLRIDAASDEPFEELTLYDGRKVIGSFDVKGKKEFSAELVIPQDQNRHLILTGKDAKGRRAVTMEIWTEQQQRLYNYCGDRINAPSGIGAEPGHGNAWAEGCLKMVPAWVQAANAYPCTIAGTGYESRRYRLDLVSPDVFLERASSAHYFPKLTVHQTNPWHNWTRPEPRDDVRHETLRQEWYQLHGRVYIHPGWNVTAWDGYPYGYTGTRDNAYYAMQEVWGETLKELEPVKGFGFVPGLSQVLWENALPVEAPTPYQVLLPDGTVKEGDLAEVANANKPEVGDLPDGSAIVIHTAKGFTARIHGLGLGYAFLIVKGRNANMQEVYHAALRVAPRSKDSIIPSGQKYAWRFETVEQVMDNPLKPDISWLIIKQGMLSDHWIGATLAAKNYLAQFTISRQPLKVNSTPFIVTGINPNWTAGYFEPKNGNYRPVGVTTAGVAYAQVDAARQDIEVVIGNLITCDQPDLRILATQYTDAEGKPTGKWRVELLNPADKPMDVALAVNPAFSLIKNRTLKATVPARGQKTLEME